MKTEDVDVELAEVQSPFVLSDPTLSSTSIDEESRSSNRSMTSGLSLTTTTGKITGNTTQIQQRPVSHRHATAKFNVQAAIRKHSTWLMVISFIITVLGEISYVLFVGCGWLVTAVTFFIYGSFLFNFYENTAFSDEVVEGTAEFLNYHRGPLRVYVGALFLLSFLTADYAFGVRSIIITLACRFSMMCIVVIIIVLQFKTLSYLKAFTYDCKFHKIDVFVREDGRYTETFFINDDDRRNMIARLREKERLFVKTRHFLRTSFLVNCFAFLGLVFLFIIHLGGSLQDLKYTFFLLTSVLPTILMAVVQVVFYNKVLNDIRADLNSKPLHMCSFMGWAPNLAFLVGCVGAVGFTLLKMLATYIIDHTQIFA